MYRFLIREKVEKDCVAEVNRRRRTLARYAIRTSLFEVNAKQEIGICVSIRKESDHMIRSGYNQLFPVIALTAGVLSAGCAMVPQNQLARCQEVNRSLTAVSYTHLRAHETLR